MRTKILYIDTPLDPPGGGQFSLLLMLRALDKTVFEPHVLLSSAGSFSGMLGAAGIPYEVVPLFRLPFRMFSCKPSLVHCNSATCRYSFAAALAAKLIGITFIWHNRVLETAGWKDRLMAKLSSRVVVISGAVADKFTFCAIKVRKLFNAVDTDRFCPAPPPEGLRASLGIGAGPVIGVFSRLEAWKGHEKLLCAAAMPPLTSCAARPYLLLAGEGPEKERLAALAGRLGLASRVIFAGFREDVPELMRLCDVVVNPSVEPEPFGRVIIEAMACGIPVVSTAAGGPSEIITDGQDGLLVNADPAALGEAIKSVLPGGAISGKDLGARAREKVKKSFGVTAYFSALKGIYEEVLP